MKHHQKRKKEKSFRLKASTRAISRAIALPVAGSLFIAPAYSQEEAKPSRPLESIVVTATKREGTVQDVPINIAAIDGQRLQEQGFANVSELLAFVPGINAVNQGGRNGNQLIVRGLNAEPLGQGDSSNNGGTVGIYIGETPMLVDLRLTDMQRVEVLLGPQGTLYGAGTLSGAIRYIPNKPDTTESSFEVRGDVSSVSEGSGLNTDFGVTFNVPLSETLAVRGSLDSLNDKGYVDYPFVVRDIGFSEPDANPNSPAAAANFSPVKDANGQEVLSGRVALRWQPSDAFDSTLTYYFQNEDNEGRSTSGHRGEFPTPLYASPSRVLEPNEEESELLALEITADLGFAELTSATGIGGFTEVGQRDQTDLLISLEYSYETFPTFTAFTREEVEEDFFNQEIRLVSTGDGPFNWIVGGFYNKFETANISAEFTPGYTEFAGGEHPDDLEYFAAESATTVEKAVFGEIGFDITDQWQVTVGGRFYEYDIQSQDSVDFPLFDAGFVAPNLETVSGRAFNPELRAQDDGSLFKINTSYQLSDDINLYATVSEGFRIGGNNAGGPCPEFDPNAGQGACNLAPGQKFGPGVNDIAQFDERAFGPDTTRNFELGAKTEWLDGALRINGAIFLVEWTDPQVASATVNASTPITVNANGAETKGIELHSNWQVSDQLRLQTSFSHIKNELTADAPSLIRTFTTPGFASAFEDGRTGDRLPGSPETQFSILASYDVPLANGRELRLNTSYAWQSDVLSRAGGRGSSLTLDSYGIANFSAVYKADEWAVTAYVDNVFDEFVESGVQSTILSNQTVEGASVRSFQTQILPPRTIGARFTYRFGK